MESVNNEKSEVTSGGVNPILMQFLDENTAKGKLQIIERYGDELDDRTYKYRGKP